jgi:uncharacterized protein YgiM (DUF1202 family)
MAADLSGTLQKADSAYVSGNNILAANLYDTLLLGNRMVTPRMLYRLATIEEGKGRIPETLYYLSLLYSLNSDDALRTRIEDLSRQYKLEGYDFDEWDFFRQILRNYSVQIFSIFCILVVMLIGLLLRRRFQRRPLRLLPLSILLLLGVAFFALNYEIRYGKAIISTAQAPVMAEPSAAAKVLGYVPSGTRVTVIGDQDIWLRVVYNDRTAYVNRYLLRYF